jgi:hypothetical protein
LFDFAKNFKNLFSKPWLHSDIATTDFAIRHFSTDPDPEDCQVAERSANSAREQFMPSPAIPPRRRLQIWDLRDRDDASAAKLDGADRGDGPANLEAKSGRDIDEELYATCLKALSEAPQALEIDGFCELPGGFDRSCRTKAIGPQTVDVVYQDSLDASDRRRCADDKLVNGTVHLDLEKVGKFHGVLTAETVEGFHVTVDPKFGGLLLTKLARYMAQELPAQREHRSGLGAMLPNERIVPRNRFCTYWDQNDCLQKGSLINISRLDAMIKAQSLPELGSMITFCGRRQRKAHVIRQLETGFSALFVDPLGDQEFSLDISLCDEFPGRAY